MEKSFLPVFLPWRPTRLLYTPESLQYLDVAGHCLSIVSFQHQLHAAQGVHCLGEAVVLLELDISLEVQVTPETESVEVLVQHLLPVRVQHRDVNVSHLWAKRWHIENIKYNVVYGGISTIENWHTVITSLNYMYLMTSAINRIQCTQNQPVSWWIEVNTCVVKSLLMLNKNRNTAHLAKCLKDRNEDVFRGTVWVRAVLPAEPAARESL